MATEAAAETTQAAVPEQTRQEKHDALIALYNKESEIALAAKAIGNEVEFKSASARKSNRSAEIRRLELEMAIDGEKFEVWIKPKNAKSKSSRPATPMSEKDLKHSLTQTGKVYNGAFPDQVKKSAEKRIESLLKTAEKLGYESVVDPRKGKLGVVKDAA